MVVEDRSPTHPSPSSAPELLRIRDARVLRDGNQILHIESFDIRRGEHLAILGPNGAGKSTLLKLITRDVRPVATDTPSVLLDGRARWDLFAARKVFGIVSDSLQDSYNKPVTVRDAVLSGYFGSVGLYRRDEVSLEMLQRAGELETQLGLETLSDRFMHTLSTGEARRALVARALVQEPPALILDEPCDGLDPGVRSRFIETVRSLTTPQRTLVMVTHHVADIIPEIERLVMLKDGRIFADDAKHQLLTSEKVSELFGADLTISMNDGVYSLG